MAYDERAGIVLLYGGAAAHRDAPLSDMWQWDGARWTEIPLTGATPGHRYQPVMVYDRARDRTVLVGGLARCERHLGVGRPGLAADQASPLAVRRVPTVVGSTRRHEVLEDDTKKAWARLNFCVLARRPGRRRLRRAAGAFESALKEVARFQTCQPLASTTAQSAVPTATQSWRRLLTEIFFVSSSSLRGFVLNP